MPSPPNDLSEVFSSILYNISDYEKLLTNMTNIFTKTLGDIDRHFFLPMDFLNQYKDYPRYPLDFKVIHSLSKYNLVSIYKVVQTNVKYLLDVIENSDVMNLKLSFDKIPESEVLRDYDLQTTYFSKIKSDVFESNIFNGFTMDSSQRSYLFKTFGYYINQDLKESSLIFLYVLYIMILRNLRSSLKIFELTFSTKAYLLRKNTVYIQSFNRYVDNNKRDLADKLTKYVLEYTYKISNPSGTFLNEVVDRVEDKLDGLKDLFANSIKIKDSVTNNIILYGTEILYNYIACKFTNSAAEFSLKVLSYDIIHPLKTFELEVYNSILERYSAQKFREYLYLVYYYKLTPRKFLNVLQLTICDYVKHQILEGKTFNTAILMSYIYQILGTSTSSVSNGIDFNKLERMLTEIITPQYLIETVEQQKIVEFATRISLVGYFEDIFTTEDTDFRSFINDLYETIFKYLKESVQIEPYFDYHFNKKMVFWYLTSYLKRDILQNKIFNREEIQISEIFYEILNSPSYQPKFDIEKMRVRTVQYIEGNLSKIGTLFDNVLGTAVEKKLHSENITYFLN